MTFEEMKEAFETYVGMSDQVDNAQLALWFNEAQLDLAYELGKVESESISVSAGENYQPGLYWLRIVASELPFRREPDGSLTFEEEGDGKLYYRAIPTDMSGTDSSQESELPLALHYLPPLFAASRYWDMESEGDSEESSHASKWLSYYYQGKNLAKARLDQSSWDIGRWEIA